MSTVERSPVPFTVSITARCPRWTPSNVPSATARSAAGSSAGERATITPPPPAARAGTEPARAGAATPPRERRRRHPEGRAHADPGAERAAGQRPERSNAPVDDVERPGGAGAEAVRCEREHHRADVDVENHDAEAGAELGDEERTDDRPARAAGQGHQDEWKWEEDAAEQEGLPHPERPRDPPRRDCAGDPADGSCAEHEAERRRFDAERTRCVEDEQRLKRVVEEVQRGDGGQGRPKDRVAADEAQARGDASEQARLVVGLDRRLLRAHPAEEDRRNQERDGVPQQSGRRAEHRDQDAAERRPRHRGEGPAPVDERVSLDVPVAARERDEQRRVRQVEEHGQRAREEGDGVELRQREDVERVGERDRSDERRPPEVARDHHAAAARHPVEPDTCREREEQVREERRRGEQAHLSGAGVEHEHGDERQREEGDLVAQERHRGREPEVAETALPKERHPTTVSGLISPSPACPTATSPRSPLQSATGPSPGPATARPERTSAASASSSSRSGR